MPPSGKPLLRFDRSTRALESRFEELVAKLRQNRPADDPELLKRAYEFAAEQHRSQKRESGDPYLSHPLEVAHVLADMKLDVMTLTAALLHDVVEDTQIPRGRISELFGADVAQLVEGVTKISRADSPPESACVGFSASSPLNSICPSSPLNSACVACGLN